jgi:hypothetical protein
MHAVALGAGGGEAVVVRELDLLGHRDEFGLVRVWYFGRVFARQRRRGTLFF